MALSPAVIKASRRHFSLLTERFRFLTMPSCKYCSLSFGGKNALFRHLRNDCMLAALDGFAPTARLASTAAPAQLADDGDDGRMQMLSFYKYVELPDAADTRDQLAAALRQIPGLRGTVYVAAEGVNGQFAVPLAEMSTFRAAFAASATSELDLNLGDVVPATTPAFKRLEIKLKAQVLKDGLGEDVVLDLTSEGACGEEISPAAWHACVASGEGTVVDIRNTCETDVGMFRGSVAADTYSYAETWAVLDELVKARPAEEPMLICCTGGIRCVKAGAYLTQKHGKKVRRLKKGIVAYNKWVEEEDCKKVQQQQQQQRPGADGDDERKGDEKERRRVPAEAAGGGAAGAPSSTMSLFDGDLFTFDLRNRSGS